MREKRASEGKRWILRSAIVAAAAAGKQVAEGKGKQKQEERMLSREQGKKRGRRAGEREREMQTIRWQREPRLRLSTHAS